MCVYGWGVRVRVWVSVEGVSEGDGSSHLWSWSCAKVCHLDEHGQQHRRGVREDSDDVVSELEDGGDGESVESVGMGSVGMGTVRMGSVGMGSVGMGSVVESDDVVARPRGMWGGRGGMRLGLGLGRGWDRGRGGSSERCMWV